MRRLGLVLLALLLLAPDAGAAPDPERESDTPTGAVFYTGQSEADVKKTVKSGFRLTDIEVVSTSPWRFTTTYVSNKGNYERGWAWWAGRTPDEAGKLLEQHKQRIIDLETNRVGNKTLVTMVTVENKGKSGKGWWWYLDQTADQVKALINKHELRITDLNAYEIGGKTRFSFVGVPNKGEDATAWWWWTGVTAAALKKEVNAKGARLIDIERQPNGAYAGVAVKDAGLYDIWRSAGVSPEEIGRLAVNEGARVFELETAPGGYAALLVGNTNSETSRIRALINNSPFNDARISGAMVKQLGGAPTVAIGADRPYQPASVMKLVPFVYALYQYDRGRLVGDDGKPATDLDKITVTYKAPPGMPDAGCPANDGMDATFTDTLRNTMSRAMKESLNRGHETLLNLFTPEAITDFARQSLGMVNTQMFYGCPHSDKKLWTESRTTLNNIISLLETVEDTDLFTDALPGDATRQASDEYWDLIAHWDKSAIQVVVESEAAKAGKTAIVNDFMNNLDHIAKGGGYDNKPGEQLLSHRAFASQVDVPVWEDGELFADTYFAGFYANDIPVPCTQADAAADVLDDACEAHAAAMGDIYNKLNAELYRPAIRKALKTW